MAINMLQWLVWVTLRWLCTAAMPSPCLCQMHGYDALTLPVPEEELDRFSHMLGEEASSCPCLFYSMKPAQLCTQQKAVDVAHW
jgi:hypothetical protein